MNDLNDNQLKNLIFESKEAAKKSYSPYSNYPVGASLLLDNGLIIQACNVENSSFGLSICAERSVIVKAVSEGYQNFKAIAIHASQQDQVFPCGACRQFIYEFGADIDVYLVNKDLSFTKFKINQLLPGGFRLVQDYKTNDQSA